MADNIIEVKNAIRDFVITQLTSTAYGLAGYFTSVNNRVYWEWTKESVRDDIPYVFFEVENDESLNSETFHRYRTETIDDVTHIYKIEREYHTLAIGFNFCAMGNSILEIRSLDAQNIASMMARLIRRKFKSDDALYWFAEGGNTDSINIGVQTQDMSGISYNPEYEETKAKHKYKFTCVFNWEEEYEEEVDLAKSALITKINDETVNIVIEPT